MPGVLAPFVRRYRDDFDSLDEFEPSCRRASGHYLDPLSLSINHPLRRDVGVMVVSLLQNIDCLQLKLKTVTDAERAICIGDSHPAYPSLCSMMKLLVRQMSVACE